MSRYFSKEVIEMNSKHMTKAIREMSIKTTVTCYYILVRMTTIQKAKVANASKIMGERFL